MARPKASTLARTEAALDETAMASVLELARADAPSLTATDLAERAGYSPFHFSRLFAARLGMGPGQYLTAIRIDTAKRLLLTSEDPVVDVATAVGFDSLSSFSRRFRATVGVPPARLRRLADQVADRPPRPFALPGSDHRAVRVHLDVPEGLHRRRDASIWVGWYACPAPIGLPLAGVLTSGRPEVKLPLCPGAPWLLGFAVPGQADVLEHLVPETPVVAAHPQPLTAPAEVTLRFGTRAQAPIPVLSALPSLCQA